MSLVVVEVLSNFTNAANRYSSHHEVLSLAIEVGDNIGMSSQSLVSKNCIGSLISDSFVSIWCFYNFSVSWWSEVFRQVGTLRELFLTTRCFFLKIKMYSSQNIREFFFNVCQYFHTPCWVSYNPALKLLFIVELRDTSRTWSFFSESLKENSLPQIIIKDAQFPLYRNL